MTHRSSHHRHILAGLLSSAALLCSQGAFAQNAAQSASADQGSAVDTGGEIVVTATRKSESISKVPLSISAFDQAALDTKGVKSITDVVRFTPGVQISSVDNKIAIRGISSDAGAGTTGIYIDDTPIQTRNLRYLAVDALPAVFDLDRVEVLRGPQGTLFGAGSEGGTVRYITPQPGFDRYTGYARAELASVAHGAANYEIGAAVGGPIVEDKLAFRVSGYRRRDGGFIDRVDPATGATLKKDYNGQDTTAFVASVGWKPTNNLTITPTVRYQLRESNGSNDFTLDRNNVGIREFTTPSYQDRPNRDRFVMASLNASYKGEAIDVVYNGSYFNRKNQTNYDLTATTLAFLDVYNDPSNAYYPLLLPTGNNPKLPKYFSAGDVYNNQESVTQELRFQSANPDARLTWVLGAFYQWSKQSSVEYDRDAYADQIINTIFGIDAATFYGSPLLPGNLVYYSNISGTDRQFAGFGSVTFKITENLKLTAGARYGVAKYNFGATNDGPFNGGLSSNSGSGKEKPFTPKIGLDYNFDRDNLLYASWSKGYRVGGVNAPVPASLCSADLAALGYTNAPTNYKSDEVTNWEIGSKNKFFDRKLTISSSVYQLNWKNIQQNVFLPTCTVQFVGNLGDARVRGFDIQFTAKPAAGLTIDGSIGFTDAKFTKSVPLSSGLYLAVEGERVNTPPWTVSIGGQYDFQAFGEDSYVRADYQYTSKLNKLTLLTDPRSASYQPFYRTPDAIHFISLRAGHKFSGVDVSLFVDNLLDKAPINYNRNFNNSLYIFGQSALRPRTIGVTASYRM